MAYWPTNKYLHRSTATNYSFPGFYYFLTLNIDVISSTLDGWDPPTESLDLPA